VAAWTSRWKSPRRAAGCVQPQPGNRAAPVQGRASGSDYQWSLTLLQKFKQMMPHIPTKSGLMLGLGETDEEVIEVMQRMREHDIDMLTLGQYLQPSRSHLPVQRFVHPDTFAWFAEEGYKMGFKNVASGPLVRSSYHADEQAKLVKAELMSS
jgi:lipoic acid synthetase